MMELPSFSRQLMQQLWSLRKEGVFCDCTILVGNTPHQAHKVLLSASSKLFRSLLESSDTISIDTNVVSSQEFGCLLDMVYTGKLPLGKHNVSHIVAAAESLQMFDLAVGFRNVLSTLVNHQATDNSTQTTINARSNNQEGSALSSKEDCTSVKLDIKAEMKKKHHLDGKDDVMEPACKRTYDELSNSSGLKEATSSSSVSGETNTSEALVSTAPAPGLLQRLSEAVQLLNSMPSVLELLSQAAQSNLDEQDRKILCQCCEEVDPKLVLEKLMCNVRDGKITEGVLLRLLRAVQQKAPSSFPALLLSLMENWERNTLQAEVDSELQDDSRNVKPEPKAEDDSSKEQTDEEEKNTKAVVESSSSPSNVSKSFICVWCKKRFDFKCRLLAHVKRCSMSQDCELQCPQCPKKLANQRALQRHRSEAHCKQGRVKKKVACDLCGRTFAHPSGLVYHKQTEHFDVKPFACEECGTKFAANSSLKNHLRLHTGEKPYHCQHCEMSFSVAAALSYHIKKKHSEGKMYVCQYCKAVFAQSIELSRHVRTHTGDRPYVCRECGKGYSQANGLTMHLQTFHNLSEPHDCKKCCLSFSSLEEHQQHIQEFHPKEFHKCAVCDKVFPSAILLDKHKATHTGSKPFSCQFCNKSYQQLSGLWYHNRTNHPEVFARQTRKLKTLVQCDLCFKFFPNTNSLAIHQAEEHQGSKSAVHCLFCKADLSDMDKVQEHNCSQHASQSSVAFNCPLCSLICTSQLELQEHLLSCHMEAQLDQENDREEQASTSFQVISADSVGNREVGTELNILPKEQSQLGASPHVLVTLAGDGEGQPSGVLEVNMYDLLNSSVAFICEDKEGHQSDS